MIFPECLGIRRLPVEVLEKIFSYVDDTDVISAAHASLLWNNVCQRIARKRCGEKVPQDILTEMMSEQEWGAVDWVELWRCWVTSSVSPAQSETCRLVPRLLRLPRQVSTSVTDGNFVFAGSEDGTLELRDIYRDNFLARTNIQDGKVHSISLVKSFNIVLVAGDTRLHFLRVCVRTQTWTELRTDFILHLGPNKNVSVFGPRFSASNTERFINVYEIFYVGQAVRTSLICEIDQVRRDDNRIKIMIVMIIIGSTELGPVEVMAGEDHRHEQQGGDPGLQSPGSLR